MGNNNQKRPRHLAEPGGGGPPARPRHVPAPRLPGFPPWIIVCLLLVAAFVAGMMTEWMAPGPFGLTGAPVVATALVFLASLIAGIVVRRRLTEFERASSPTGAEEQPDTRAVMLLVLWPITLVAALVPLFTLWAITVFPMGEGTALPTALLNMLGALGFYFLPRVAHESVLAFRGRGMRGFWRAARETPWGDGMP